MVRNLPGLWLKMVRQPNISGSSTSERAAMQAMASVAQTSRIAPLVLEQLQPVGDARQVARLHVGGEVRAVVGERARVEDVALGDVVPAAVHQVLPGELA